MPEAWYSRASSRRGSYAGQSSRSYGDSRSRYPHDENFIQDYSYARQPARSYGDSRTRYPHDDEDFIQDYSYARQPARSYGDSRTRYPHDDEDFIQDYSYARQPARSYGDSRTRYPHDDGFIKDYPCIMDLATAEHRGIRWKTKMVDITVTNPLRGFLANMKTGNTEMGNFNHFTAPVEIYNIAISKADIGTLLYMALIMSIMRGWIDHLDPIRVSLIAIIVVVGITVIIETTVVVINGLAGRV
ncbi:hypothetical protein HYFRA_00008749 [Hymenoscyphus fraxineus]|uniref:Uncharacterized protein n=1 Tax=Hymenoscyphus fraxineus TaxID=746836 RepID=A0A9N9PVT0_9HELO|nr:hypothetical protein HYFRA_00008749 [Hymenoscyphus fraxineus]